MPVALLMIMAPNSGDQPSFRRSFTKGFRCVKRVQKQDDSIMRRRRMSGTGVLMKLMRAAAAAPKTQSVTRSPRQAAIGGAILSVYCVSGLHRC